MLIFSTVFSVFALDDLPMYLDAGCSNGGIPKSFAQGPTDMVTASIGGTKAIPINCTDKKSGTDAAVMNLGRKLVNGEYYDFIFKWGDDRSHSIKGYADLRLWIKNKNSTVAKFRLAWEQANYSTSTFKNMEIAGGGDWKEYIIPLTELGSDSVAGLKISQPLGEYNGPDINADPINILLDSITVTDGTGNQSLAIPDIVRMPRPAKWPSSFLVGSFDNRDLNASTVAAQAGCPYRYQYMMPETRDYYSASGKGYLCDYATESKSLGVKTAVVWYNLGKSGEGYGPVSDNLQSSTYMDDYFDRYDWVLDQLALAGQSDYMIIIEPDMYGFIMRGEKFHPAEIPVVMTKANSLSGKTYDPTLTGWAKYLVERAHAKLPNGVIIGHMPNHWGVNIPGQVGQGRKEAHLFSGLIIGQFIKEFGPIGMGDVVFVEKTDHDAGHKPANENWFWDSTGYAKYFLWTSTISNRTGLPIVGWQVSEGNMSNPTATFRDNAAETFLDHPDWWTNGGFIGILFGAGNGDCVNYKNDNDEGWFVNHMKAYNESPYEFPLVGIKKHRLSETRQSRISILQNASGVRICGWAGIADIEILTLSGQLISRAKHFSGELMSLPIIKTGLYLAVVSSSDGVKNERFVFTKR